MPLRITRLTRQHDRRDFDSGEPDLDAYLHRYALQNDERDISRTYVAVDEDGVRVRGYFTLTNASIRFEELPARGLPKYPIPAVLLARLAVDRREQGLGLGRYLLFEALHLAESVSEVSGVHVVLVHALHEKAKSFYMKHGFSPIPGQPLHLYMTMKDVRSLNLGD